MKQGHAQIAGRSEVSLVLLKTLQYCHISLEGCIMCSSIPFIIFGVEKQPSLAPDFRQRVALILKISAIVFDVELDLFMLVEECTVMYDSIFLTVADEHEV